MYNQNTRTAVLMDSYLLLHSWMVFERIRICDTSLTHFISTIFSFIFCFISSPLTHIRNSNLCRLPPHICLCHLFGHSFTASFNKYLLSIYMCQAGGKVLEKVQSPPSGKLWVLGTHTCQQLEYNTVINIKSMY